MKIIFKYLCYLLTSLLLLSGCENQLLSNSSSLQFDEATSVVKLDRTFTIALPANHPDKLAIRSPVDTWFYLQGDGISKQLMPEEDFIKTETLTITPLNFKATHWVNGKEVVSPVFFREGIYSIYLSDNLETELDNSLTFIKRIRLKK